MTLGESLELSYYLPRSGWLEMSVPSLRSISILQKRRKRRRWLQEVSTDPFPAEVQGGPPRTGPRRRPGSPRSLAAAIDHPYPIPPQAHGGLDTVQLLREL